MQFIIVVFYVYAAHEHAFKDGRFFSRESFTFLSSVSKGKIHRSVLALSELFTGDSSAQVLLPQRPPFF